MVAGPAVIRACSPVTVKTAELVRRGGAAFLKVTGVAPSKGLTFEVRPVVYVMQPDFWQMSLVGCTPTGTIVAAVRTPFAAEVNVYGWAQRH